MRVDENRVLRRTFGPEREKLQKVGKDCIMN
jgi:hypothetical protein